MLDLLRSLLIYWLLFLLSVVLCLPFVLGHLVDVIVMLTFVWDQMRRINILIFIIDAAVLAFVGYHVLLSCLIMCQRLFTLSKMMLPFFNQGRVLIFIDECFPIYFHVIKNLIDELLRLVLETLLLVINVVQR